MSANASPRWRAILQLCRFSNSPTVWSNVLAGWFLAGRGLSLSLLPLLLGATALYFAGTTLNDAFDANFDRQYRPERPIPCGVLTRDQVSWLGMGWMLIGIFLSIIAGAHPTLIGVLITSVLTYNYIHKRTRWAGLLMGGARSSLILVAGSAGGSINILVAALALTAFLYIAGLTWLAAGESGPKQHVYPIAQSALLLTPLILLALSITVLHPLSGVTAVPLALIFGIWIAPVLPINRLPLPLFKGIPRLLAAIILIDSLALTYASPWFGAVVAVMLFPLALYLQKSFAAT